MSHFISTRTQPEQPQILTFTSKKLIEHIPTNFYRKALQKQSLERGVTLVPSPQQMRICTHYVEGKMGRFWKQEKEDIFNDNINSAHRDYKAIKKKWKRDIRDVRNQLGSYRKMPTQVQEIMGEEKDERPDLQKVLKNMPKNIDTFNQHYQQAANSYASIYEALDILKQKQKQKKWYDQTRNSPKKSANFLRMHHILSRLKKEQESLGKKSMVKKNESMMDLGIVRKKSTNVIPYIKRSCSNVPFDLRTFNINKQIKSSSRRGIFASRVVKTESSMESTCLGSK